ncbi:MAG: glycine-rich protein, partial [Bacteroidales bacterium]|nr:glycine-rich protein [Bacteroidales bacterium]
MKKMNRFNKKNQVLSLSLVLMLLSGLTAQNAYSSDLLVTHTGSVTFMASSGSSMDGCLSYGNSYSSYAVLRSDLPSYPVRLSGTNDNVTEVDPPETPTVEAVQVISCGESVVLSIVNPNAAYTYNWYSDAECTQFVYTGISFTTPVLHNNTTYYVKASVLSTFVQDFSYTGDVQSFVIPQGTSELTLEVWGAAGGYYSTNGGSGGYAAGTLTDLSGISTLYVYVGGQGAGGYSSGGYNGGGKSNNYGGSGGGATDISTEYSSSWQSTTHYNSRLIVAGGGGGAGFSSTIGGYGGGSSGGQGGNGSATGGYGGSQSSGGSNNAAGMFGTANTSHSNNGGGGGGGWYGGASGIGSGTDAGGGGGSGYVNTVSSYHPSGYLHSASHFLSNTSLIAGNATMPNPDGGTMTGRTGNGFARISGMVASTQSTAAVVSITVEDLPAPTAVAATSNAINCGEYVELSATTTGQEIGWYTESIGGDVIGTTTNNTTLEISPNETTTYYAASMSDNGNCVSSERVAVTVTVVPTAAPEVLEVEAILCGETTTLSVANPNAAYTYNWYSDAECTQFVHTGTTFTTPILHDNTTYYVKALVDNSFSQDFTYTGGEQTFVVPQNVNELTLEVWGAQGGYRSSSTYGGKGGYSIGTIAVAQGDIMYVNVGGSGNTGGTSGGYNGGGSRYSYSGGGGATHIATVSGILSSLSSNQSAVKIVAGGGGSDGSTSYAGAAGGGLSGITATGGCGTGGGGGTQSSGGTGGSSYSGIFGQGGYGAYYSSGYGGSGGGGWYGGGATYPDGSVDDDRGGGGGSGYIGGVTNAQTIAGNQMMPNPTGGTMTGRTGNGFARISGTSVRCASPATAINITVNALPAPTAVAATPSTITCGEYAELSATTAGEEIGWYTESMGGDLIATTTNNTTLEIRPNGTTTYYAASMSDNGNCISPERVAVTTTVNPMTDPTVEGDTDLLCGETTTLTASGSGQYAI